MPSCCTRKRAHIQAQNAGFELVGPVWPSFLLFVVVWLHAVLTEHLFAVTVHLSSLLMKCTADKPVVHMQALLKTLHRCHGLGV